MTSVYSSTNLLNKESLVSIIPKELLPLVAVSEEHGKHLVVDYTTTSSTSVYVDAAKTVRVTVPTKNIPEVAAKATTTGSIWKLNDNGEVIGAVVPVKPKSKPTTDSQVSSGHRG